MVAALEKALAKQVERGKLDEAERAAVISRVTSTTVLQRPGRLRSRHRVGRRGPRGEEAPLQRARPLLPQRRDPRHQHLDSPCRRDGRRDRPARAGVWHPLLQPRAGDGTGRDRAAASRVRRDDRRGPGVRRARAARTRSSRRGPRRIHRQRAALPLPQQRGADARGGHGVARRHRRRDEGRLQLPDGPASRCSTSSDSTRRSRSSTRCTTSSAIRTTRRPRCCGGWSAPAVSAASPATASTTTASKRRGPPARMRPIEPPTTQWQFPPVDAADEDGLVGVGADLEPGTLLAAYRNGLFPMPVGRHGPMGWWSPDPRGVLPLDGLRVSRSLRRSLRRYELRVDTAFEAVMRACGDPARPGGWITEPIVGAFVRMHDMGWAHSVEAWSDDGELVGGAVRHRDRRVLRRGVDVQPPSRRIEGRSRRARRTPSRRGLPVVRRAVGHTASPYPRCDRARADRATWSPLHTLEQPKCKTRGEE